MNVFARIYSVWLGGVVWVCLIAGCQSKIPIAAQISGSSMAPTLHGDQQRAYCETCDVQLAFAAESIADREQTTCPHCGSGIVWLGLQTGQRVGIQRLSRAKPALKRGETVVFRDPAHGTLEVKRVVGLPNESLTAIDGDLWIDGQRVQKTIAQFAEQSMTVERWKAIESVHRTSGESHPVEHGYHSRSLWPRLDAKLEPHSSPILDEYPSNAAESRQLVAVRDIGLKLVLSETDPIAASIEIRLWVDDAVRRLPIRLSATGIHRSSASPGAGDRAVDERPALAWEDQADKTVIVAMVDGRLLVGTEQRAWCERLIDGGDTGLDPPSDCSSERPVGLVVHRGLLPIKQAFIVRDIHYRGWDGEARFLLPAVEGYHLLGDNVSNSVDSRQRWPQGVPAEWIIGRIEIR